jgi:hypothetical protein
MAAVLIGWAFVASSLPDWMFLLGGLLLGLASYALIIWLLKVNEFQQFQKFFIRKIFKK